MESSLAKYFKGDKIIWIVIVLLSIFSLLAVYSSTGTLAFTKRDGNVAYYIFKHTSILIMGLIIIFVTHLIPYKYYSRLSQLFLFISIPMLILTLAIGSSYNQALRWLTVPGIGLTFQTSDFAKLTLIMYLARQLSLKQNDIRDIKQTTIYIILPVIVICVLILPANLSTAAILFFTSLVLMFIGRVSFKHIAFFGLVCILAVSLYIIIALAVSKESRVLTWKSRIEAFFSGNSEDNFQVEQSKIAIAKGGVFRVSPGKSTQRNFLPHPYSDFIYSIIIEEYGLTGGVLILFLYLFLLFRTGTIVKKCDRTFPAFLAIGLSISIVFQAMINMAVAVNIIPVTGQTLPLISMGGSSILFTCTSLGIILSISRSNNLRIEGIDDTEQL